MTDLAKLKQEYWADEVKQVRKEKKIAMNPMELFGSHSLTPSIREMCYRDFKFGRFVKDCLRRFYATDWGNIPKNRFKAQDKAFRDCQDVVGTYTYADNGNLFAIWIVRYVGVYKRKYTVVMYPEEF